MWCIDIRRLILLSACLVSLCCGGCDALRSPAGDARGRTFQADLAQRERDAIWHAAIAAEADLAQKPATTSSPAGEVPVTVQHRQSHHIAGWFVYCTTDRLYDRRGCLGIKDHLHIGWYGPGMAYVTIGKARERAPKQAILLRIDADPPFTTYNKGWSGAEATQIMARLLQGQQVLTRHRSWPADQVIEQETSLESVREVWDSLQTWVKER